MNSHPQITATPNGNPDITDIRASYLDGQSTRLASFATTDIESITTSIAAFQQVAKTLSVRSDMLGVVVQCGIGPTKRFGPTDWFELSDCVAQSLRNGLHGPARS